MAGRCRVPTTLSDLRDRLGAAAVTPWETHGQAAVDAYAAVTGEDLWIHTDPGRAASSSFGGTIVPSSLLLARFGAWLRAVDLWLPEPAMPLNYGYDRIRIPGSLRVGAPCRGRLTLATLDTARAGMARLGVRVAVEAEGTDVPVLAADWLMVFVTAPPG